MNLSKQKSWLQPMIAIVLLGLLIMVQGGVFASGRIEPGYTPVQLPQSTDSISARVIELDSPRILEESGVVSTKIKAGISPRIMGLLTSIEVENGDMVEKDQILARIDSENLRLKKEQAQKALFQAESAIRQAEEQLAARRAALEQAEKNFKRISGFRKTDAASEQQLEEAEALYRQAKALSSSAEESIRVANLEKEKAVNAISEAELAISWSVIKAPFSGIITARHMDPGEMAVVGKPIVTLNDTSQYEIVAHLRETLSQYIKKNTEVELKIGELETTGSISEIIPRIDPENRTFEVRISFSPKNKILIGSYARVFVPVGTEKRLLIPRQFVRRIGQISTVMVKNEKGVNTRYIRTGIEKGGWLEIRSGLKKGETVILGEKKQ